MKARFVDNKSARPLVTIREDEPIWNGQEMIDPIPEGAIVRAYIPEHATEANVEHAIAILKSRAASLVTYRMPKGNGVATVILSPREGKINVRAIVMSMVNDPEMISFIEETFSVVGL